MIATIRAVDLFAGAGGLSWGLVEALREVAIALCIGCAVPKPSNKLYTPTGVPDRSRTDLSERGRA